MLFLKKSAVARALLRDVSVQQLNLSAKNKKQAIFHQIINFSHHNQTEPLVEKEPFQLLLGRVSDLSARAAADSH